MKFTGRKNAHLTRPISWRLALVCSMLLLISGCGVDSGDGDVATVVVLPATDDLKLDLYCADFGLFNETCVLDDPKNPYAFTNITNDNKFDLAKPKPPAVSPSLKAKVYLWATAQARFPSGENQYNTAAALYALSNESCSQVIQDQALKAYRSVLDNYFTGVTFFGTDGFPFPPPWENVFYPFPVKILVADNLRLGMNGGGATGTCDPSFTGFMFDPVAGVGGRNDFLARAKMAEWGYLFDDVLNDLNKL